jgi:periplasmic divalent cation tolerance protein
MTAVSEPDASRPIAVVTTVATLEEARRMAQGIVERRLAACAQVSQIESCYRWDGEVRNEAECRIVFKTTGAVWDAIERAIRELHGYELPAIHALALDRVSAPYAQWIVDNVGPD